MTYLKNAWYVAGWANELVTDALVSRRLLDEPVVLFRDKDGRPAAVSGICPHRYAPLARGSVADGLVVCGYHGLGFDGNGACAHNPFGQPTRTMSLRSYPLVERYSALWIWMGDKDQADPDLIPDYSFNEPSEFWVAADYLNVKASYELEIDNILDLSHIQFLHASTLGSDQVSDGVYEWKVDGETVWSNRMVHNEIMVPEMAEAMGLKPQEPADRWINVRWNVPANLAIFSGAVPAGTDPALGDERPLGHFFTPETSTSSHYWFSISFPKSLGPDFESFAQQQIAFVRAPFEHEDLPMLEDQQRNLGPGGLQGAKLGWLPGDAAGARARKILYDRIAAEQVEAVPA